MNCAAVSCPPIACYKEDKINQQLNLASQSFLDQSIELDPITKTITISMLFSWYRQDFGETDKDILDWIKKHSSSELLQKILTFEKEIKNEKFTIKYATYNWNLNEL